MQPKTDCKSPCMEKVLIVAVPNKVAMCISE